MYLRKVSEIHRPIIIIEKVWTPPRNKDIATPEQIEWVPISLTEKLKFSSVTSLPAERNFSTICGLFNSWILLPMVNRFICELIVVFG